MGPEMHARVGMLKSCQPGHMHTGEGEAARVVNLLITSWHIVGVALFASTFHLQPLLGLKLTEMRAGLKRP